jgi:hypothetical protein
MYFMHLLSRVSLFLAMKTSKCELYVQLASISDPLSFSSRFDWFAQIKLFPMKSDLDWLIIFIGPFKLNKYLYINILWKDNSIFYKFHNSTKF